MMGFTLPMSWRLECGGEAVAALDLPSSTSFEGGCALLQVKLTATILQMGISSTRHG